MQYRMPNTKQHFVNTAPYVGLHYILCIVLIKIENHLRRLNRSTDLGMLQTIFNIDWRDKDVIHQDAHAFDTHYSL